MELSKEILSNLEFDHKLINLYNQIKKMKLKHCITIDKKNNVTESAKIIKKGITKRSAVTNDIYFKMDDFINWSIHEYNFNEIVITDDSIQLFDNDLYTVTFTK
jgi:hypothetical protein